MKLKLAREIFKVMESMPDHNWQDGLRLLFEFSLKLNDDNFSRKIFYRMVFETNRTKDIWLLDFDDSNKLFKHLKRLGVSAFAEAVLREVAKNKRKKKIKTYRSRKDPLCACCHEYLLTVEEIHNFPARSDREYVFSKFELALTQPELNKRRFLADRLLREFYDKSNSFSMLFELWFKAEHAGAHVDLCLSDRQYKLLLTPKYFKRFIKICSFRAKETENIIDDVLLILLKQGRYDMAHYLSAKIYTPLKRLEDIISCILRNPNVGKKDLILFRNVYQSVRHEL